MIVTTSYRHILTNFSNYVSTGQLRATGGKALVIRVYVRLYASLGGVSVCVSYVSPFFSISYLQNAWAYFHETYRNYLMPGPHYIDYIFKVMCSKVKVRGTNTDGHRNLVNYR